MRILPLLLALTSVAAARAWAQDPTVVDSTHYQVVFENDHVRVLRITYGPHEKSVMHYHPAGVVVFLTDNRARMTLPDSQTVEMVGRAGEVIWTEAGSHLPENMLDRPIEVIAIELKTPESRNR